MTWSRARRIRQIVQTLFLALFVYLLLAGIEARTPSTLASVFFRFNPLSALASMLAARAWLPGLGWALVTIVFTLLLGRVWCGWVCPLGTLLEWVSFRGARKHASLKSALILPRRLRSLKYFMLAGILALALFGSLALLVFDPIALFTRTMTSAILPALFYAINAVEAALYAIPFLQPGVDWVDGILRSTVLPVKQPAFAQNLLIASLFFALLGLNALADRFWCRYLCPLGAMLGLLSKVAILRPVVGDACNHCTRCALVCHPGAVEANKETVHIQPSECTVCLDCLAGCKKSTLSFRPVLHPAPAEPYDLSRREALGTLAVGAAGLLLLRTDLRARQPNPFLIRPPGVTAEEDFLTACLRCSQCMQICPTTALQPAAFEGGLEGLWTPVLVPRVGYCDYGCNACGLVCPSGAIPNLVLEAKRQAVLGKATVNRNRCLPWASSTPCIVCEEMCPTPQKSIRLEEVQVITEEGENIQLQRPYVLRDLCIGCGICENHCPLEGEAGIRIFDA